MNFELWDSVDSFSLLFPTLECTWIHTASTKCDGIFHAIDMNAPAHTSERYTKRLLLTITVTAVEPALLIYGLFAVLIIKCSNWKSSHSINYHYLYWQLAVCIPAPWGHKLLCSPLFYDWVGINSFTHSFTVSIIRVSVYIC